MRKHTFCLPRKKGPRLRLQADCDVCPAPTKISTRRSAGDSSRCERLSIRLWSRYSNQTEEDFRFCPVVPLSVANRMTNCRIFGAVLQSRFWQDDRHTHNFKIPLVLKVPCQAKCCDIFAFTFRIVPEFVFAGFAPPPPFRTWQNVHIGISFTNEKARLSRFTCCG